MPKIISPELINEIQDRCDIVELISSYIPLKKAGRNFKANCPFHSEKTPSFIVSPDKQIFHCFGCSEGGNALSFLMKYEHLDFKEAIQILADRAGIVIQLQETSSDKEKNYITELYRINEIACDFYQTFLVKNLDTKLVKYLDSRKLNTPTLNKFKIGLAPNKWDSLLNLLRSKGINIKLIEKAGLIISKSDGGYYDRFRNRLIIPIQDIKNRIIAFGARALDDSEAKYINSPETPIYIKGNNLFGLNLAKDSIREKDYAIIVEGYFDIITPMQAGLFNIVSSSGTALTIEQIRLLKRHTRNVIVVFDSDAAGQMATLRSLEIFLEEEMQVNVVDLPKGYDPDLFTRSYGIEKFQDLIDKSLDIFEYKLKMLSDIYDFGKINEKTKIVVEMLSMIKKIKNEILKSEYIKLLAEKTSVGEETLLKELAKIKINPQTYNWSNRIEQNTPYLYPKAERMLVRLILDDTKVIEQIKNSIKPTDLQDKRLQKILEIVLGLYNSYTQLKPHQILSYIEEDSSKSLICELTNEETLIYNPESREKILYDCIKRIQSNSINLKCQNIQSKLKAAQLAGNVEYINRLKEEFNLLIQTKKRGKINEEVRN